MFCAAARRGQASSCCLKSARPSACANCPAGQWAALKKEIEKKKVRKRHGGACQLEWCSSRARGPSDAWGYTPHTSQSKAATRYGTWQTPATSPTCPGKRSAKPKRHGGAGQLEWCSSPDRGASGAGGYTLPMPLTTHGNRYGTAVAPATSPNCPGKRSAQIAPTALRPWHAHGRTTVPAPDPVPARPCARARI